ncbi:MAG: hypothetical protein GFH27_549305n22 [Chloroflexi bacterium AL-W]|nr:hypothetical protein [Chloroflexi bacterium AL-N1]NOK69268.1 hypothetical protein [Chloroflexi bacterium AL-N10]NOK76329.1 hypothetical protein [Chloroflexi bacterium AL-N5]NOK83446.1 hypothetical protein [Chloroflexi bacterium AL-W]NOK91106.1 hypothetical protein [Chloroflexi bacterium AL-N15]
MSSTHPVGSSDNRRFQLTTLNISPQVVRLEGGTKSHLRPIETIQANDYVFAHDGSVRRVQRVVRRPYMGHMIGLCHRATKATLWLTNDHQVLAKLRPRTLGGNGQWSAVPPHHFERSRKLRRNQTPAEQILWAKLRGKQLGYKFRRQHPIGPYIADFYSRAASLVVEVDGETHSSKEAQTYDRERDRYMRSLGLDVLRITNTDVYQNLDNTVTAIWQHCEKHHALESAMWVQAKHLQIDDFVFFGVECKAVCVTSIETQLVENEEVFDLQVEELCSYMTEVCAIQTGQSLP